MPRKKATEKVYCYGLYRTPERERLFTQVKGSLVSIGSFYGFEELHTPILEDGRLLTTLARANLLDVQPIFGKSRSGVEFALRSAGAVGVLRAYTVRQMGDLPHPLKFVFSGDRFFVASDRDENFGGESELGLEMIGEEGPIAEAEIIQSFWKALGENHVRLDLFELRVNATGCSVCYSQFRSALGSYFRTKVAKLCKKCKRSLKVAPTKILVCEDEKCSMAAARAPQVLDYVCEQCRKHLRLLLEFLDEAHIPYFLDARLFREGSLYDSFVFEIAEQAPDDKKNDGTGGDAEGHDTDKERRRSRVILAEGGRMSRVATMVYGKRLDAVSGRIFFEAVEHLVTHGRGDRKELKKPKVFLVQLGELAKRKSLSILEMLRAGGVEVKESLGRDSIKSQLKVAERVGTKIALILGQKEALDGTIIVREVQSGIQETISQDKLVEFLKLKLKK